MECVEQDGQRVILMSRFDKRRMKKIGKDGKFFFLAMDHGLEHGPADFNDKTIHPEYVIDLATKMRITGLIFQKGLALRYNDNFSRKIPLIVKLNGKTNLTKTKEPFSSQITSVKDAARMGADAVGYTLYLGSGTEHKMMEIAGRIEEEARDYGLPLILWSYPRGSAIKNPDSAEMLSYAARCALEIGADIAKIHYTGSTKTFRKVIDAAGRCSIVTAGGSMKKESALIKEAKDIMSAGASGMAVGRNIWQHTDPVGIANSLASIIFDEEKK